MFLPFCQPLVAAIRGSPLLMACASHSTAFPIKSSISSLRSTTKWMPLFPPRRILNTLRCMASPPGPGWLRFVGSTGLINVAAMVMIIWRSWWCQQRLDYLLPNVLCNSSPSNSIPIWYFCQSPVGDPWVHFMCRIRWLFQEHFIFNWKSVISWCLQLWRHVLCQQFCGNSTEAELKGST